MPAPTLPRNAVALVVGIGEYRRADRIAGLRYAARDARAVARILRDPEVCGFPRDRVKLLTEGRASRANVVRHLSRWLPGEAKGADLVVLYFAGHGTVEGVGGREEGYFLPHDADPDDIVTHGIAMADVARWIEGFDARAVLVCLDCCHAGGILPAQGMSLRAGDRDMQIRPSHLQQLGGRGRFLIASCDRGQKSIEAAELKHGLFTYHLLRGLRGDGDRDRDGRVSVAELFGYVSAAVSREAQERFGREQTPWTSAIYNEDVVLSIVPTVEPPPRSTVEPDVAMETGEDQPTIERLRQLRKRPDLSAIAFVFGCLAHRSEQVRSRARQALAALDWERVVAAAEAVARTADAEAVAALLDGLEALETHARVVGLLDRLAAILRGGPRDRALWLLDRKKLAQERERLASVFRDTKCIYEIVKVLGPGTYTGAYLAKQEMTELEVVVRVLRAEYAGQPLVRSHFLELGAKAVRLVHQNLVLTREVRALPDSSLYFTVRDFIPGVTLRQALESGKRFDPPQACKILRQVLDALAPLHRDGLVHAGVKPSNIFLSRDDHVTLGDPSLPLPAVGHDLPRLAYDFRYAPPELFRAGGVLVSASDYYSLGCVACELFHGAPPFVSDSPFDLIARHERDRPAMEGGPDGTGTLLGWLLHKQPGDRPGSADDIRALLDLIEQASRPRRAAPSAPPPPADSCMTMPPRSVPLTRHAADDESKPLMREQSLMEFEGRESIVPLSRADGGAWETTGGEAFLSNAPGDIKPPSPPGYEILGLLGQGGMGVVYRARQVALNRDVALKMIVSGHYTDVRARQRFLREGEAMARLDHPNIVAIYDLGAFDGVPFFSMELCEGGSLAQRLRGTPMEPRAAADLLGRLSRAVQVAHENQIIHRDLKPGNVLFSGAGQPKITDFGLARQLDSPGLTVSGAIMGTPAYMAPEQVRGSDVTFAADVYSLGAMLYECLTGRPPFRESSVGEMFARVLQEEPTPPRSLNPSLPRDLEILCLKCLEKEPQRRYPTAGALADDLGRFLAGEPIAARGRSRWSWWPFR